MYKVKIVLKERTQEVQDNIDRVCKKYMVILLYTDQFSS
jgi:hypothetical protein